MNFRRVYRNHHTIGRSASKYVWSTRLGVNVSLCILYIGYVRWQEGGVKSAVTGIALVQSHYDNVHLLDKEVNIFIIHHCLNVMYNVENICAQMFFYSQYYVLVLEIQSQR